MKYYTRPNGRIVVLGDWSIATGPLEPLPDDTGATLYREQCRDDLRALVPRSGARMWTTVRHVSRSGTNATVCLYVVSGDSIVDISRLAGDLIGQPVGASPGISVANIGGMQWALANRVMSEIWPGATTADLEFNLL